MNLRQPNLPPEFLERLRFILTPENYQQYLRSLEELHYTAFRVNPLKAEQGTVVAALTEKGFTIGPIPWCPDAYHIPATEKRQLTDTDFFKEGLIYIQNLSSMFASLVLDPRPGEEILDLAAAPGGKTVHMAALMANQGRIAAIEPVRDRFFRLRSNVDLAAASIVQTYCKDGTTVWRAVPARFDRVLLDAPCSSEARFNPIDPKSYAFWSPKKIMDMQRKQKMLIYSAIQCLKPNGTLVYCTCSFAPEENEAVVQYALDKFKGLLEIVPLEVPFSNFQPGLSGWQGKQFDGGLNDSVRIIPNELMSGFFICKLYKKAMLSS